MTNPDHKKSIENQIVLTDNWEELTFAMLRSKELSPACKGFLNVLRKMPPEMAAREAHLVHTLMHARLLKSLENENNKS